MTIFVIILLLFIIGMFSILYAKISFLEDVLNQILKNLYDVKENTDTKPEGTRTTIMNRK